MTKFQTPGPISVKIDIGVVNVRITASDRTDTIVDVRPSDESDASDVKAAQQVRVHHSTGILDITGPKARIFDFSRKSRSVNVSIELPSGSRVTADMQAGDVRTAGRLGDCQLKSSAGNFWLEQTGPLRLDTSAGNVTAEGVNGSADVSTGSGRVQLGEISGTAVVKNTNGDTTIEAATGNVRVRAANGNIRVERAGAGVDAKTSNGNIHLGSVSRGSIVLATAMGNLDVGIAEGTAARLEMTTQFGQVRNLLENAARPQDGDKIVELRANTSFGDITIHRS